MMRGARYWLIVLWIAAVGGPVTLIADQSKAEELDHLKDCVDHTTTNFEWGKCSSDEISRQESRLTEAWLEVSTLAKSELPEDAFKALTADQENWVRWKNSACKLYSTEAFGREGQVLRYGFCKAGVIAARVTWLKGLAEEISR